jgi:hypothetical protein
MLKKLIQRCRCHVTDWLLRRLPHYRAMPVTSPRLVRVKLLAETGEKWLSELEWDVTLEDFPELKGANCLLVSLRVWEDGDTSTSHYALAHLLPDKRPFPLPPKPVRRAWAGTPDCLLR